MGKTIQLLENILSTVLFSTDEFWERFNMHSRTHLVYKTTIENMWLKWGGGDLMEKS